MRVNPEKSSFNPEVLVVYPRVFTVNPKVFAPYPRVDNPGQFSTLCIPPTRDHLNKKASQLHVELKGF
jgi:hypothetical protein